MTFSLSRGPSQSRLSQRTFRLIIMQAVPTPSTSIGLPPFSPTGRKSLPDVSLTRRYTFQVKEGSSDLELLNMGAIPATMSDLTLSNSKELGLGTISESTNHSASQSLRSTATVTRQLRAYSVG